MEEMGEIGKPSLLFAYDMRAHKGDPDEVKQVCCDMWPAYIDGVEASFPQANITFDHFHIMKIVSHAVDEVRRQQAKTKKTSRRAAISGSRTRPI
jgi:transposase